MLKFLPIAFIVLLTEAAVPARAAEVTPPLSERIASFARTIERARPPGRDGVLTVADGNLYVQCRARPSELSWRCESAGVIGQPWMAEALTTEAQAALSELGFRYDESTGNYLTQVPTELGAAHLGGFLSRVIVDVYGAESDQAKVMTDWIPSRPCPARIAANTSNGGGIITPSWGRAAQARLGCVVRRRDGVAAKGPPPTLPGSPPDGPIDPVSYYRFRVAAQLERLLTSNAARTTWMILDAGSAYIQCGADNDDHRFYCEAVSQYAVPFPIGSILTPDRKARLIDAGFHRPGRVLNYWRYYDHRGVDLVVIADALLTVLRDVYGYRGGPPLKATTN